MHTHNPPAHAPPAVVSVICTTALCQVAPRPHRQRHPHYSVVSGGAVRTVNVVVQSTRHRRASGIFYARHSPLVQPRLNPLLATPCGRSEQVGLKSVERQTDESGSGRRGAGGTH
eukprot:6747736-Pyramimonas_sp.AAC.1